MGGRVGKHRLFRRSRGIHRIRDSGFPQRGRPVSPEIPIPAGNHPEPQLLCAAQGGVLRFLPGQDAGPLGRAQRRPPEAGPVGAGGAAEGRHYSREVLELHGSVLRNYCERCGAFYGLDTILHSTGVPRCPACGGDIKPDVVLYEESLDQEVLAKAVHYIRQADLMIIGGTSLVVYPAAGLVQYFRGRHLVVVNKGQVGSNVGADLTINGPIGQVFSQL